MRKLDLIKPRWIACCFTLIVLAVFTVPAGASSVQVVSGKVLHAAVTGAVARNAWAASNGAVNGVAGYAFLVEPSTIGKRFIVTLDETSGFEDTNITFYSAYSATAGTVCANYTFLNPSEAGRACGTLAVVWTFSGGPISFTYRAGDGVAYGGLTSSTSNMTLAGRVDFTTGTDLAFEGNYAYVGSEDPSPMEGGLQIIDITNPSNPSRVGHLACPSVQNDVAVWNGIVAMAIDSASSNSVCSPGLGKEGVRIVDARNPAAPAQIAFLENVAGAGAHTITTVGDTGYLYVNNYIGATVDVINLNPTLTGGHPTVAGSIRVGIGGQNGCHDITVDGANAYCASLDHTEVWDITNPLAPAVVSRIYNPLIDIHHSTAVQGDILVIGDEFTGAEAAAGCTAGNDAPFGALWFYDISDPSTPRPLGYFTPPEVYPGVRCTAHNFNIIPDTTYVVAAWYKGGTRVIDFSDPSSPTEVAYAVGDGASTWSAYWWDGAIVTGDMHRGTDIFTVDLPPSSPLDVSEEPTLNLARLGGSVTFASKPSRPLSCSVREIAEV